MQGDAPARAARAAHSNSIGSGSFMRLRSGPDAAHDTLAAPPIPPESAQPSWGLQHPNMLQYPPVPMPPLYWEWGDNQLPPVRRMTAAQYADLQARYVALDVPHAVVFPFLHGVDGDNRSQNLFFGAPAEGMPTPNYRGLTLVRADMPRSGECLWASGHDDFSDSCSSSEDIDVHAPKRASVDSLSPSFSPLHRGDRQESFSSASAYTSPPSSRHDSLASTSTSPTSRSSVSSVATPPGTSASQTLRKERAPYEAQPEHSYLTSTVHPTEILGEVGFINPRPPAGVSLRNFRIQCAKYATISDLVIYCPAGLHDGVFGLARRFQRAQDLIYRERLARGLGSLKYNIFVIEDAFEHFEQQHPSLVAVNSQGCSLNRVDFIERERVEMENLSRASEIDRNVLLGSNGDLPLPASDMPHSEWTSLEAAPRANPYQYAICVEAHEMGETPSLERLGQAASYMDALQDTYLATTLGGAQALRDKVQNSSGPGSHASVPVPLSSVVLIESAVIDAQCCDKQARLHADQMIDLAMWIKCQADPGKVAQRSDKMPRKVLIHCADGYTETSALALTYLMTNNPGMSLPEAYLFLQNDLHRSFFVYPHEVRVLSLIEAQVRDRFRTPLRKNPRDQHGWFYDPLFEGSFPSRILDFLYLGNLSHAMNASMLHALGITHVVSVGESALSLPPGMEEKIASTFHGGRNAGPTTPTAASTPTKALTTPLWTEREAGRISVLDLLNVSDDGIDPLRSTMKQAVEYIEAARRTGGKVLVHCRVGVSRSSTIVLAYAMAHLDLSLVETYLLVRSRRLNILIQPHLLFFWELRGWETYLARALARHRHRSHLHAASSAAPAAASSSASATPAAPGRDHSYRPPLGPSTGLAPPNSVSDPVLRHMETCCRPHPRSCPSARARDAGPHELLPELPECQQYLRQVKSVPRFSPEVGNAYAAGSTEVLLARPCGFGAVLEAVFDVDGEDDLDVELGAGAAEPATGARSDWWRAQSDAPTCGYAMLALGRSSHLPQRALRLAWGVFAREIATLNERYCV